jgi:succinate dehydrogenase hydrophobic anchor subunit
MSLQGQQGEDIRATLALSQAEVRNGTTRTLNLPGGRRITLPIAAGTRDGQVIRLPGQGEPSPSGGSAGDLILTIAVSSDQYRNRPYPVDSMDDPDRPTDFVTPVPPLASTSSPNYATTSVNSSPQQPLYVPQAQDQYSEASTYNGGQQPLPPPRLAFPPEPPERRRRLSKGIILMIVVLALLLIVGSGLILYSTVYVPGKQHADATATVQSQLTSTAAAQVTGTAQAHATSTAQAIATSTAQANATSTAIAGATATATALQNLYTTVTGGSPALNDPLSGNDANNWDENQAVGGGGCGFSGGAYHATMPQKGFYFACFAQVPTYTNFAYQVQLKIISGDDGGIVFRGDSANYKFYRFYINQKGTYCIDLAQDINHVKSFFCNASSTINTGLNSTNILTVIAQGSNIHLYINKQYIASLSDNTYSSGKIGVFVGDETSSTDAAFNNAKVWNLP